MPEFYIKIARKFFSRILGGGGGTWPPDPPSPTPMYSNLHIIMHFCSEFWGLVLHQISNFCPVPLQELHPALGPSGNGLKLRPSPSLWGKFRPLKINFDRRHWYCIVYSSKSAQQLFSDGLMSKFSADERSTFDVPSDSWCRTRTRFSRTPNAVSLPSWCWTERRTGPSKTKIKKYTLYTLVSIIGPGTARPLRPEDLTCSQ